MKRTTNKEEVDVSCWNCFTTEDVRNDLDPVPLIKIREEQREKFKLYSFLASELSKPKAVPLKQKVSTHYSVSEKIDEKICQNSEVAQYLRSNTKDAITDIYYLPCDNLSAQTEELAQGVNKLTTNNKEDKSTETEINITLIKLYRSDSSSSSSKSPDFRPKRKLLVKPNLSQNQFGENFGDKKKENLPTRIPKKIDNKPNLTSISKTTPELKSTHMIQKSKVGSPLLQTRNNKQSVTPKIVATSSVNKPKLSKEETIDGPTNEVARNSGRLTSSATLQTSSQKERENIHSTREQGDNSLSVDNHNNSGKFLIKTPSTSSVKYTKTSVEPVKPKTTSLKQKIREQYPCDKTTDEKPLFPSIANKVLNTTSPRNELPKSSTTLKQILNEHYLIDKEIDETIAKYADLTKSKLKVSESKDSIPVSKSESPRRKTFESNHHTSIVAPQSNVCDKIDSKLIANSILTSTERNISMSAKSFDLGTNESMTDENIEKLNTVICGQISTPVSVNKFYSQDASNLSYFTDNERKNNATFDDKQIDEIIAKCADLTISETKEVENKNKVPFTTLKLETIVNKKDLIPIKVPRLKLRERSLMENRIKGQLINTQRKIGSKSSICESNTDINLTEENFYKVIAVKDKKEEFISKVETNPSKVLYDKQESNTSDSNKVKSESIKLSGSENKERSTEKADNASSNGSESGYAGSSGTVQYFQENYIIHNEIETDDGLGKNSNVTRHPDNLEIKDFKSSLPALNSISEKNILKTTTTSKSLIFNINNTGIKTTSKSERWSTLSVPPKDLSFQEEQHDSPIEDPNSSLVGPTGRSYTLNNKTMKQTQQSIPTVTITRVIDNDSVTSIATKTIDNESIKSTTNLLLSNEREASSKYMNENKTYKQSEQPKQTEVDSRNSTIKSDDVYLSDTLSSGNATLPRRSSSPLPNERDLDRDRFPINRSGLQARSESMASVYSGAGEGARGSVAVRGEVQFSLLYNYRLGALEVGVKRCRDLAPVDTKRNRSDPYVKVYLLPDKSKAGKRKTKVKKNTLNPVFEETLSFAQPLASLSARTLWLSVWHADMFGRNDFLGEVTLPLADVVFDDPAPMWHKLHERTEQFEEQQGTRGDLIVGLKFELQDGGKGTLHVLVKEAKNLLATKPNGLADVFCKSYLLPERGRLAKQKTSVVRRTLNPRWEHTFTYRGLTMQELATRALELSLWDRDRLASNDFMGAVRLSLGTGTYMGASVNWMDSMGKEVALWQTMMQRPNFWVEGSLPLRPQLNN
ncbi:unnamed protein product [Parnassius apollo]|uniref:(apollo) hypothetical protein n=1 Tax=Parnassius apollo TaxID=110799 RepID=A0A8S3WZD8_PARAO|nr:unnamed protein product [Parnassius apollo]